MDKAQVLHSEGVDNAWRSRNNFIQVNRDSAIFLLVAILYGLLDGGSKWIFHVALLREIVYQQYEVL